MSDNQQMTARQMRYRRQQERKKALRNFFALSFVCILILAGVITAIIEIPKIQTNSQELQQENDAVQGEVTQVTGIVGPELREDITYTDVTASIFSLPENGRVDMEYFSDALFIGDSLTQGFQVYSSGISNAKYAAYTGVGPRQLMEGTVTNINGESVAAIDEILAAQPKKVYLLIGTNTLSSLTDEAFLKYYEDFLNFLQPQLPADTVYYLQAIPPVKGEKSQSSESYSNARIRGLNEHIAKFAYQRGWNFLNLYNALANENGDLREDIISGSDGVHLNGSGYELWKEYLVTHTAYSDTSPYIAGSPYIKVEQ